MAALYLGQLCDDRQADPGRNVVSVRVEAPEAVDDAMVTHSDDHVLYVEAK